MASWLSIVSLPVLVLLVSLACSVASDGPPSSCMCPLKDLQGQAHLPQGLGCTSAQSRFLLRVVPSARDPFASRIALLSSAHDLAYANRFWPSLESTVAYAELYRYDRYLYIDQKGSVSKPTGLLAVLSLGHEWILFLDMDAIFEPRVFVQPHPLEPFVESPKSLLLLGEHMLSSGIFFLKNSEWGRWFAKEWETRCATPRWCNRAHTIDPTLQFGLAIYEHLLQYTNETSLLNARKTADNVCKEVQACRFDVHNGVFWGRFDKNRLLAYASWPEVAFLAYNGTKTDPQLVNAWALRAMPFIGYRPAVIKHHCHDDYAQHVAPYATTHDMPRDEIRDRYHAHDRAFNSHRWPGDVDWNYKLLKVDQILANRDPNYARTEGNAVGPQPSPMKMSSILFLGFALQKASLGHRWPKRSTQGLQLGLGDGVFAYNILAGWPACTTYTIVPNAWDDASWADPEPAGAPAMGPDQAGGHRARQLLRPWAKIYRIEAKSLESIPDGSLHFAFLTAPQRSSQELAAVLLPLLWQKLVDGAYLGGHWWGDCDGNTGPLCKGDEPAVRDVRSQVLAFAESVERNVQPTRDAHPPTRLQSWYMVK